VNLAADLQDLRDDPAGDFDLRSLFHQLSNQLGIVLAHAELLEAKAADETTRARLTQVVTSTLEAMNTARKIRRQATSSAV
jgi:predicted outer membrane protein